MRFALCVPCATVISWIVPCSLHFPHTFGFGSWIPAVTLVLERACGCCHARLRYMRGCGCRAFFGHLRHGWITLPDTTLPITLPACYLYALGSPYVVEQYAYVAVRQRRLLGCTYRLNLTSTAALHLTTYFTGGGLVLRLRVSLCRSCMRLREHFYHLPHAFLHSSLPLLCAPFTQFVPYRFCPLTTHAHFWRHLRYRC